jgi:DNA replication ATP-dependent helicase Dna2
MPLADAIVEKLLDARLSSPTEAGAFLLEGLSEGRLNSEQFLANPGALDSIPRYVTQVVVRALQGAYETVDDVIASLEALEDRRPPLLEPGRRAAQAPTKIVIPEARVVELGRSESQEGEEARIVVHVTSGPLRGEEIQIRARRAVNRTVFGLVPRLWIHAAIAVYNIPAAVETSAFEVGPETFIVIEPMRQINVTTVARSLRCAKPQIDQIRRGKGDVTTQTLKGQLIHALFDRMLEGATNLDEVYDAELSRVLVALASVTDAFFNEEAFRADVLRHAAQLGAFIDANPGLREHAQLELKRYSATLGIQGRIDALFHDGDRLDILELKTGAHIRPEDHAQLFIYRLLVSDYVRRRDRSHGSETNITARLLSSVDGSFTPLQIQTDFQNVLDARNTLVAAHHALSEDEPHFSFRYEGFDKTVCGGCASWTRTRCRDLSAVFGDHPDSVESPHLAYFRRFTRLVERERWSADEDVVEMLDDNATESRVKRFRAIAGARIVMGAEPFTFEFDDNTSDIATGDAVLVHAGNISSSHAFHGYVRAVEARRMRVFIPVKNLSMDVFQGQAWTIDRLPADVTAEASHTALYDFLVSPMDVKKRVVLADGALRRRVAAPYVPAARETDLNGSQMEAIHHGIHCETFHLIWGPPGTGKTKVIPRIVEGVDGPVLLGAFTNTAVDKMLLAVLDRDPTIRFLRMGRAADSPELARRLGDPAVDYFSEDLAEKRGSVKAVREALQGARIVAATAHRAATLPYLRTRPFEMAIIDEAGQLTEPLTLGLILRGRRFVLIGDDRQLPPVVRTRALGRSLFERLKSEHPGSVTLLDTQYRMHPGIMAIANRLFYDGRLRSGVAPDDRTPPEGAPVSLIPIEGASDDRRNPAEAAAASALARAYMRDYGISGSRIGVVSPFRAQVALMRQMLEDTGITVDTIERFQGGERDVMILSFVRPSASGFVFDERRLNVAITRARRKLVLVAHPNLFRGSSYEWIYTFTEAPKTAGAI